MSVSNHVINVVIAEASVIIRSGLAMALKRLPNMRIQPIEVLNPTALDDCLMTQHVDILIVNPAFGNFFDVDKFKSDESNRAIFVLALVSGHVNSDLLLKYDATISIFDEIDNIATKLSTLQTVNEGDGKESDEDVLSQREKEIVICVVKGMTNKAIADKLFLSIHTVVTHRKNISRKLQIHSISGLTIYAIVNKLIALDEVKTV